MKKETNLNLQCDWEGICNWWDIPEQGKREIKKAVVEEVDAFRNQSWWRRLLNIMPEWKPFEAKNQTKLK